MANQGFTAADMADQYATAFERGRESVLAELRATAQEAVAWTVVGPDGKSSIGGWQDMKTHDFWKEAGVLREGHRYAYAYAAPVTAAPGIDRCSLLDIVAWWNSYTGPVDEALGEVIRRIRTLIDASPKGDHFVDATKMVQDSPKGGSEARDAARWRYVRRKLCLTGNGDGTCGMQAINLPGSIPGWPDTSDDVVDFCEAAIDAAMQAQASDAEVRNG